MQVPLADHGPKTPRDLNMLCRDYLLFCNTGKRNIKNAKKYNDVIGTTFFDIPLAQVMHADQESPKCIEVLTPISQASLPGLHISLGIFMKLWTLLEAECHKLDLRLAQHTTGTTGDRETFLKYSAAIHDLTRMGEEKENAEQHTRMLDGVVTTLALQWDVQNPRLIELRKEAAVAQELVHTMVYNIQVINIYLI